MTSAPPTLDHGAEPLRTLVHARLEESGARVFSVTYEGRKIWVKRVVPDAVNRWHRLQKALGCIIPIRLLRHTSDGTGQASLDREAVIIERLRRRGAVVPDIVARGDGWIALSDLGPSLQQRLDEARNQDEAMQLSLSGAWALLRLQRSGGWHGNAQARNLAGDPDKLGFLDFEEDVGAKLGAESAQIRDWFLYLCSLYKTEKRFPGLLSALIARLEAAFPPHVYTALLRIRLCGTVPALLLRPFGDQLGRDVRQTLALWHALGEINPALRRRLRITFRLGLAFGMLVWLWGDLLE